MKKMLLMVAVLLVATVSYVSAQTTDEQKASEERVEQLKKAECPKECGTKEIDEAVKACKSIAESTLGVAVITKVGQAGNVSSEDLEKIKTLPATIKGTGSKLEEVAKMLPQATEALKTLKNPMKLNSAKKSIDYINQVSKLASLELPFQTALISSILSAK